MIQISLGHSAVAADCKGDVNQTRLQADISRVTEQVAELKADGWTEGSIYAYGRDESPSNCKKLLAELYGAYKKAVPDIKIIAATDWPVKEVTPDFPMDAWVHLYHEYNEEAAKKWIDAGKEYWGYHCIEPSGAHNLNTFIEKPLIDARLLFWYAAGRRYQGWLFWATDLWKDCKEKDVKHHVMGLGNASHPALLDFDPASYIWCPALPNIWVNGDGYITYPGVHGPINTQRLEGIRDGLEDWEMFRLLQPDAPKSDDRSAITNFTNQLVPKATYTEKPGDALLLETLRRSALTLLEHRTHAAVEADVSIVV